MKSLPMIFAIGGLALAAMPAAAQDTAATTLPPECEMLGPELSADTIATIKDQEQVRQALSCMVGTPRVVEMTSAAQAATADDLEAINIEEAWGSETVAEGLAQSAEAMDDNAALQTALTENEAAGSYLEQEGYTVAEVIGVWVNPDGSVSLFVAPEFSTDAVQTGSVGAAGDPEGVQNEEMANAMEEAVKERADE